MSCSGCLALHEVNPNFLKKPYFLSTVEIKDYNFMIDRQNFFDDAVKNVLFQKKNQTGQVEDIRFRKAPWNIYICHFTPLNSRQKKLSPLGILQNCVTPLEIPRLKTKTYGKST